LVQPVVNILLMIWNLKDLVTNINVYQPYNQTNYNKELQGIVLVKDIT